MGLEGPGVSLSAAEFQIFKLPRGHAVETAHTTTRKFTTAYLLVFTRHPFGLKPRVGTRL